MKLYSKENFCTLPDAVIFDLDNTLYAYNKPCQAAMDSVKDKVATTLSIDRDDFESAFSVARNRTKETLGTTAASHSRLLYFQATLEDMGLGSQPLLSLDLEQTYWRVFLDRRFCSKASRRLWTPFVFWASLLLSQRI